MKRADYFIYPTPLSGLSQTEITQNWLWIVDNWPNVGEPVMLQVASYDGKVPALWSDQIEAKVTSVIENFLFNKPKCTECKGFQEVRCYVDREQFKLTGLLSISFETCRTCVRHSK